MTAQMNNPYAPNYDGSSAMSMDELRELRKARVSAGEWQPIETAPKDGTVIDLWDGSRRADFKWLVSRACPEGVWFRDEECVTLDNPTHWMPLPKPPAA